MKILHVASALPGSGGIEKSVLNLAEGMREQGHEVHITVMSDSWTEKQLQARGFTTLPLAVRKQHDFRAFAPYVRLFQNGGYDVVNTHYSVDYLVPALAAKRAGQRNIVLTRYIVKPWRGVKGRLYGTWLYDHLIAVSDAVRNALLAGGIPATRVTRVHGGVPVPAATVTPADLRGELQIPAAKTLIGIVSRIAPEKGHRFLLEAMRSVDVNGVCLVVGEGEDRAAMEAFVRENHLTERVKFLGWRLDSEAVMAALDIIVQPSQWEEACSLAIMEGMAAGRPMVVTRAGGNPELITDGDCGFVVPKADSHTLANALNILIRDPERRRQMGKQGQARQKALFSVQTMAAGTEAVYLRAGY